MHPLIVVRLTTKLSMNYTRSDIFKSSRSIVHCVSADFVMGAGIAKVISDRYGRDNIHKSNKLGVGWKVLNDGRLILYMVTKEKYWMKPTLADMKATLINLRILCQSKQITELSMPRIGCGLDKLSWDKVEQLIISELVNHNIEIHVHLV